MSGKGSAPRPKSVDDQTFASNWGAIFGDDMQRKTLYATDGETVAVSNQWAAEAEKRGTTVSSSAWEYTGDGSLAGASLSGMNATVRLTPTACGTLVNTATLANGETLLATRSVVFNRLPAASVSA